MVSFLVDPREPTEHVITIEDCSKTKWVTRKTSSKIIKHLTGTGVQWLRTQWASHTLEIVYSSKWPQSLKYLLPGLSKKAGTVMPVGLGLNPGSATYGALGLMN